MRQPLDVLMAAKHKPSYTICREFWATADRDFPNDANLEEKNEKIGKDLNWNRVTKNDIKINPLYHNWSLFLSFHVYPKKNMEKILCVALTLFKTIESRAGYLDANYS